MFQFTQSFDPVPRGALTTNQNRMPRDFGLHLSLPNPANRGLRLLFPVYRMPGSRRFTFRKMELPQ